jgi:hypothetical protein
MPTAYGYVEVMVDAPAEASRAEGKGEDVVMGVDAALGTIGEVEKAVDGDKEQDEQRQEAADKADGMDGVEAAGGEEAGKDVVGESTAGPSHAVDDARLPSAERQRQVSAGQETTGKSSQPSTKKIRQKKYYVGEEGVNVWRAGMEVGSMMTDGISTCLPIVSHASTNTPA